MLQPEVSVFSLSEQKVLWACKESLIFIPFHISRLVICELSPHFFSGLTQPQAGRPVPRTCHLAGIKHSVLQFLCFKDCNLVYIPDWLLPSLQSETHFHHHWPTKSCKNKAQFQTLLYPSSFWDVNVVQKQQGSDTLVSHFPESYNIVIIWGRR